MVACGCDTRNKISVRARLPFKEKCIQSLDAYLLIDINPPVRMYIVVVRNPKEPFFVDLYVHDLFDDWVENMAWISILGWKRGIPFVLTIII